MPCASYSLHGRSRAGACGDLLDITNTLQDRQCGASNSVTVQLRRRHFLLAWPSAPQQGSVCQGSQGDQPAHLDEGALVKPWNVLVPVNGDHIALLLVNVALLLQCLVPEHDASEVCEQHGGRIRHRLSMLCSGQPSHGSGALLHPTVQCDARPWPGLMQHSQVPSTGSLLVVLLGVETAVLEDEVKGKVHEAAVAAMVPAGMGMAVGR